MISCYCPRCGNQMEFVDSERFEREQKPQAARCTGCGQGWEIIGYGNNLLVSEAPEFARPTLGIVECESSLSATPTPHSPIQHTADSF